MLGSVVGAVLGERISINTSPSLEANEISRFVARKKQVVRPYPLPTCEMWRVRKMQVAAKNAASDLVKAELRTPCETTENTKGVTS